MRSAYAVDGHAAGDRSGRQRRRFPALSRGTAGGQLSVRSVEYLVEGFFEGFVRQVEVGEGRITPQLLRNSFAADLFARGLPREDVQERMGYFLDDSVSRLHAAWRMATGRGE